jgi:hypothetical protein
MPYSPWQAIWLFVESNISCSKSSTMIDVCIDVLHRETSVSTTFSEKLIWHMTNVNIMIWNYVTLWLYCKRLSIKWNYKIHNFNKQTNFLIKLRYKNETDVVNIIINAHFCLKYFRICKYIYINRAHFIDTFTSAHPIYAIYI